MTIEITGYSIIKHEHQKNAVRIYCIDISEEHLQQLERRRLDKQPKEMIFEFSDDQAYSYLYRRLSRMKQTQEAKTWGDALSSIVGTVSGTCFQFKYRVYE